MVFTGALMTAVAVTACDGGLTEAPFLPQAPPGPGGGTPERAPLQFFRGFSPQVQAAVESRDVDFFLDSAQTSTLTCPNEFEPRCEGQPEGAEIEGIAFGRWRSERSLLTPEEFRGNLTAYLDSLPDPALYALARPERDIGGLIGGPAFFAVAVSSDNPSNTTRIFGFVFLDGEWRMSLMMEAPVLAEEWLSGECSDCYDQWERWEGAP